MNADSQFSEVLQKLEEGFLELRAVRQIDV